MNSSKSVCSRQSTRSHLSTRSVHSSIQTTATKRTSKNTSGTSGTTTRNTTSSSSTSQRGRSKSRSGTMISNNDNSNNGSTNGSTSNNIRRKSQALIHGLDELDLRVAAIIAVDHIERQSCSAPVSAGSGAVNDCNISIISNTSTTRSTKNRGRSRSTNRAHSSTSGNGNISPNKSVSGRSVTSTRSHREVRDAAIARTILLQAKSISTGTGTGTTRTSTSIRHARSNSIGFARKTKANANSTFDDDAASVVSNYTVHDILGDLVVTDTNPDWDFDWDAKSVKSTRSRSRRSHSRSRSACTTASMTASASASASHSRNASAPNVNVVSNLGRQPRSRSRSTSRSSPRSASKPRSTSRSSSTIRTRAKSVASTIRLPPDDRDRDRDWGKNSNTNKGETETEDLYNAFMKNLTKEQKLAHITITDTNGDADDADANANADANAATFHDGAKSEGTEMEQWALDLFQQSQGSNDDGFGAFRDTCTGVNIHTTTRIPTSTIPTSTAAARTSKSKHNAIHKPILSRFSSAPESFQLESFDPERSNVFELDSKRIHTRTHTFTTRTHTRTHTRNATAECDSFQAFAPVTTKPAPRYTFEDQNMNTKIAHVKHTSMNTSTIPKQSRSHKPFRSQPQLPGPIPTSPSRNAIAPPRRANSLPTKTTSKNSFVPVIASKVTDMTTRTQARRNANLSYNKDFPSAGATSTSTRIGTRIETSSPSGPIDSWKKHDHDTTRNSRPSTPLHFDAMDSLDNAAFDRGEFSDPFPSRDDGNGNGDFGWKGFVTSTAFETIPSGWDTEEEGDSDNDNDNGDDDDDGFFMQAHHDPLSSASTPVHVAESSSSLSNQSPFPAITNPSEWSETSPNGVAEFDSAAAKWLKGSPTRSRRGGKDKKGTFTRTKKTLFSDDLGENSDTYGISDTTGWV
mmetsp:Transcript_6823/g.10216  ORF Transcript_6823/g.10216 Transcript_6823/m.10216 type:complete len:915 (+) Transcript_6823:151-2895(+)